MKPNNLKISVALCTYNGAQYLSDQLESINNQIRKPDELVVCDDNSNDNTIEILQKFKKHAEYPIKIFENKKNIGPSRNFQLAIIECSYELIFLCDQDDVWDRNKLLIMEKKFSESEHINYVFSNGIITNRDLISLGYNIWDKRHFHAKEKKRFKNGGQVELLLIRNFITGATMAIRKKIVKYIIPIPETWIHDAWIATVCSLLGLEGDFIDQNLIYYRQHEDQAIGIRPENKIKRAVGMMGYNSSKIDAYILRTTQLLEHLSKFEQTTAENYQQIEDKLAHYQKRKKIGETVFLGAVKLILMEISKKRYWKFSDGLLSIVKDFLIVLTNVFSKSAASNEV